MKNIKHRIFTINVTLFAQVTSFVNCLLVCPLPPWSLLGQLLGLCLPLYKLCWLPFCWSSHKACEISEHFTLEMKLQKHFNLEIWNKL